MLKLKVGMYFGYRYPKDCFEHTVFKCVGYLPNGDAIVQFQSKNTTWNVVRFDSEISDNTFKEVPKPKETSGWLIVADNFGVPFLIANNPTNTSDLSEPFKTEEEASEYWKNFCYKELGFEEDDFLDIIEVKWSNRK